MIYFQEKQQKSTLKSYNFFNKKNPFVCVLIICFFLSALFSCKDELSNIPEPLPILEVSNLTAICYDGKTHISWTNPSSNFAGVEIFLDNKKLDCEIKTVSSSVYGNYSYCVLENFAAGKSYIVKTKSNDGELSEGVVVNAVETGLPVVVIDTENCAEVADKVNKIPAMVNILNSNDLLENAAATIKIRGRSSSGMPKKPYTIKFDSKTKVLGMKKHKTWSLIANYADKTLLRNSIAYEMGRKIFTNMDWSPSTKNIHLLLNGEYLGLYMLTESIKIDENRVNVPNIEKCKNVSTANEYGFLLEVNYDMDEDFNFISEQGLHFSLKDPDGADISTELQQVIQETVQKAEDALYSNDFADENSENYFENYFDVDSFIDWWLANEIAKNNDAVFFLSCYMYFDPADQKLHMGPLWDFDIGFGNINYNDNENPRNFYNKNAGWLARMFQDENFTAKAKARWNEKYFELSTFFNSDVKLQFEKITPDANINFARWKTLGIYLWPNPAGYENRTTYESECAYFNNWISARLTWLNTAINNL